MKLTFEQLCQVWVDAGGDPDRAGIMAAIAIAESGGDTNYVGIRDGQIVGGLWPTPIGGAS